MWRYLALASAIVLGVVLVVLALPHASHDESASRYSSDVRATAGPAQRAVADHESASPVTGDAPWALSALPECFRQLRSASGPAAFVRAKMPRDAKLFAAGTRLRIADCTLEIGYETAIVTRGENRLSIPAIVRISRAGANLVVERYDGSHGDGRIYAPRAEIRVDR